MKVKATTNFAGAICMSTGEIRDGPKRVAAPLLKCGYLEAVEPAAKEGKKPEKEEAED